MFKTLEQMLVKVAEGIRPPERLTVSQAAEKYRQLNNRGSYVGPWKNSVTPYLIEPMDVMTSDDYQSMIFVGPAQSGKTDMAINFMVYAAICDPSDMMIVQTTKTTAEEFAEKKLHRAIRDSKMLGEKIMPGKHNQTLKRMRFTNGMIVSMSWPTINELSGKTIPRLWLTDYDRMTQDVDGEGNPFDLAKTRARSFRQYAMTVAESSPGMDIEDVKWMPKSKHQAPPVGGILSLYNRGDRRRWYWPCPSCHNYFEPDFNLLTWPDTADINEAAANVELECPHCAHRITHDGDPANGKPGKHQLNQVGVWLRDGTTIDSKGVIHGEAATSEMATFWLKGVAATFSDWKGIVLNYLRALDEYDVKGLEESLRTTTNVDQGNPYKPKSIDMDRLPETLKDRSQDFGFKEVPLGARFLVATFDVQNGRFVVQVHGVGEKGDMWIIDRFDIKDSNRRQSDGRPERIKPGAYLEDWKLLIPAVLEKTYPLGDGSGRHMQIKLVAGDSAGEPGVTKNAYDFYRYLKHSHSDNPTLYKRFMLIKGGSTKGAPRVKMTFPDSQKKDRYAEARKEIPVLIINTTEIKNSMSKFLDRTEPGGNYISFPDWLPDWFYEEMTAERYTSKGWAKIHSKKRNEAWDLICYCHAVCVNNNPINIENLNWGKPPSWASEWDVNSLVSESFEKRFDKPVKKKYSISELAEGLAR